MEYLNLNENPTLQNNSLGQSPLIFQGAGSNVHESPDPNLKDVDNTQAKKYRQSAYQIWLMKGEESLM